MKKNIRGIRKIENKIKYIKKKEIEKTCEVIKQEIEEDKSKFRLVSPSKKVHKKEKIKQKEVPKIQENTECFQLVVIENIPWYKRVLKAIGKFLGKQVLVKSGR